MAEGEAQSEELFLHRVGSLNGCANQAWAKPQQENGAACVPHLGGRDPRLGCHCSCPRHVSRELD